MWKVSPSIFQRCFWASLSTIALCHSLGPAYSWKTGFFFFSHQLIIGNATWSSRNGPRKNLSVACGRGSHLFGETTCLHTYSTKSNAGQFHIMANDSCDTQTIMYTWNPTVTYLRLFIKNSNEKYQSHDCGDYTTCLIACHTNLTPGKCHNGYQSPTVSQEPFL